MSTTPLKVIEVSQGLDHLLIIADEVQAALNKKKMQIINVILGLHYNVKHTAYRFYEQRVTRVFCANVQLAEQYYLDYQSPESPGLPIAAFYVQPGLSAGNPEVQLIYETPNNAVIPKFVITARSTVGLL